jgi:pilus assembly protein TadC
MLTLPMVVFILPTVLMVVAGPAAVQLLRMH